jgi:glycosyltransferase involved in cell wall biosynthesis
MTLISVLCPTRNRSKALAKSVKSLRENQTHFNDFELLLAVDPDDHTLAFAAALADKLYIAPERWGYGHLNRYYNELAKEASGDWLLLWNDDAVMVSQGWDATLASLPARVMVAELQDQKSPALCCFPAVRREAMLAVGGFSPHTPHCDTYWQDIGRNSGRGVATSIHLRHERFDMTGENRDATYQESQAGYQTASYYSGEVQSKIAADIETVRRLP